MFDLHSISLTNFRSYRGDHLFDFPVKEGLYFFTGSNNTALGSNGAGKSTLLDAIVWSLYGRTTRGLKANEIISWGAESCQVELELTVGPERLRVKRSQKPNTIFLNDKPVDQYELEKHLRLNYESFMYSVINAQFGESFLALSPAAKLTLFSDIMGLDFWLKKSEEASDRVKLLESQIGVIRRTIASAEGQIESTLTDISTYQEAEATFDQSLQAKIALKRKELVRATNDLTSANDKIEAIAAFNSDQLKKAEEVRDRLIDNIQALSRQKSKCLAQMDVIKGQIKDAAKLKGECPTCHQMINSGHMDIRLNQLNDSLVQLQYEDVAIEDDLELNKKQLVKIKNKIDKDIEAHNEIKDKKNEAKIIAMEVSQIESALKGLKETKNPYAPLLAAKLERLKHFRKAVAVDTATLQTAEAEQEAVSFWVKGFKRVRLFIIEQAFRTLEIEINNSLTQLGMPDWQITFDVERENKSGGFTKGFVVFVKSPANNDSVRWESWSGGETQRLQLAGDLGLANLIMTQAGLNNTTEFFDEPSTHLSPEGMMDLANMLHERAINEGKRIWIVDHASITNFGEFEGIITARKTGNGSTITYTEEIT